MKLGEVSESVKKLNPALFGGTLSEPEQAPTQGSEAEIHDKIIAWCRGQHPMVAYIHARMDKRTTIGVGCPDFVVVYNGRVLLVECKIGTSKLRAEQRDWAHLARLGGGNVHVVRSFTEFLTLMKGENVRGPGTASE